MPEKEEEKKEEMTWQEKQAAVAKIMQALEMIDFKADAWNGPLDVLAAAAQLTLPPGYRVDLIYRMSRVV